MNAALAARLVEAATALEDDLPEGVREIPDLDGDVSLDELDRYCVGLMRQAAEALS